MVIAFYGHGPEGVSPMDVTNNPCFGSLHILLVEQATPSGGFFLWRRERSWFESSSTNLSGTNLNMVIALYDHGPEG